MVVDVLPASAGKLANSTASGMTLREANFKGCINASRNKVTG
jgi:hypothetical protein